MKRRTRKQWYAFHLAKAQEEQRTLVDSRYRDELSRLEARRDATLAKVVEAEKCEPGFSQFMSLIGISSNYRSEKIDPLRREVDEVWARIFEIKRQREKEYVLADQVGAKAYREAHAERKMQAISKSIRRIQRKRERRIRYLERAPNIRSAGRFLKSILIDINSPDGIHVNCSYCGITILASESHLEHRRPVSRGGDNRRSNLTLSCAPCNLKKGKKTDEEFIRWHGNRPR